VRIISALTVGLVTAALLGGCATPTIDRTQLTRPKTVAIVDFPDAKPAAIIGLINARWPQAFFLGSADPYFIPAGGQFSAPAVEGQVVVAGVAGAVAGRQVARANHTSKAGGTLAGAGVGLAVGALIDAGARETQKKAEGYPAAVQRAMPGVDIRTEVLGALYQSLQAKGITVTLLEDSRNLAPRLRWPATQDGKPIEAGELADSPPVDADIVAQVVPLVVYASPGPLNNYNSVVGIGLALYEGRTRKFLGWQAFQSDQNKLWYARYDSLVADIGQAAPAQHVALMSLIPQVADAISGGK
jgi:hypothetical protein